MTVLIILASIVLAGLIAYVIAQAFLAIFVAKKVRKGAKAFNEMLKE